MPERESNPEAGPHESGSGVDYEVLFEQAQDNPEPAPGKTYADLQAELTAAIAAEEADPRNRDLHKAVGEARKALNRAGDRNVEARKRGVNADEVMGHQEYVDGLPPGAPNAFEVMQAMEAEEQAAAEPTYEDLQRAAQEAAEARDANLADRSLRKPAREALKRFAAAGTARMKEQLAAAKDVLPQPTMPQLQQAQDQRGAAPAGPEPGPSNPDSAPTVNMEPVPAADEARETEPAVDDEQQPEPMTKEEVSKAAAMFDKIDKEWAAEHPLSEEDRERARDYAEQLRFEALNSAGTSADVHIDNPEDPQLIRALRELYDTEGAEPTVITNRLDDTTPYQAPHDSMLTHGRRFISRIPASESPSKWWEYRVYIVSGKNSPSPKTGEDEGGENQVVLQLRYLQPRENRADQAKGVKLATARLIYVKDEDKAKGQVGALVEDKKGNIVPSKALQAYMDQPITHMESMHGKVAPTSDAKLPVGYVEPVVYGPQNDHGHGDHGHGEHAHEEPVFMREGRREWSEEPVVDTSEPVNVRTGESNFPDVINREAQPQPGEKTGPKEHSVEPGELGDGEFSSFSLLVHEVQKDDPNFGVPPSGQLLPPQVQRMVDKATTVEQLQAMQEEVLLRAAEVRGKSNPHKGWTDSEHQILDSIKDGYARLKREEEEAAAAKAAAARAANTRKKHEQKADQARQQTGLNDLDDAAAEMASREHRSEVGMRAGYVTAEGDDEDMYNIRQEWSAKPGKRKEGEFTAFTGMVEAAQAADSKLRFTKKGTFSAEEGRALLAQADTLDKLSAFDDELTERHRLRMEREAMKAKEAGEPKPDDAWDKTETQLQEASKARRKELTEAAAAAKAAEPAPTPQPPEAPAAEAPTTDETGEDGVSVRAGENAVTVETFTVEEGRALLAKADTPEKLQAFDDELMRRHRLRVENAAKLAREAGEPDPGNVWDESERELMLASNQKHRELTEAAAAKATAGPETTAEAVAPAAPAVEAVPEAGSAQPEANADEPEEGTVEAGMKTVAARISPDFLEKNAEGALSGDASKELIAAAESSEEMDDVETYIRRRAGAEIDKATEDRIEKRRQAVQTPAENLVTTAQRFDDDGKLDAEIIDLFKNRAVNLRLAVRVEGTGELIPVEGNPDSEMVVDILNSLEPPEEEA